MRQARTFSIIMKGLPYVGALLLFVVAFGMKGFLCAVGLLCFIMAVGTICLPRAESPQGKFFHLSIWILACLLCFLAYYHFWGQMR